MPTKSKKIKKVKKIKKIVKEVYDFHELTKEVERISGKDIRDWAGRWTHKWGTKKFEQTPSQDFWRFICDNFEIHNGCTEYMDFEDILLDCDEDWQKEVCRLYIKVAGPGIHEVLHAW